MNVEELPASVGEISARGGSGFGNGDAVGVVVGVFDGCGGCFRACVTTGVEAVAVRVVVISPSTRVSSTPVTVTVWVYSS